MQPTKIRHGVKTERDTQPYQLRLPKETVRDLQILRVFGGVKVSDELRELVYAFVESKRVLIDSTTATTLGRVE